jgi:acyl carrier protein
VEISREAQEKLARALGGGSSDDQSESAADAVEDVTTLGRIARIIEDVSGVDKEVVTAESDLTADLDLSSVSLIEIGEDGGRPAGAHRGRGHLVRKDRQ